MQKFFVSYFNFDVFLGGKTILSISIASMILRYHGPSPSNPKPKRLLYICYNTLVRMSVANACEQASIPFW